MIVPVYYAYVTYVEDDGTETSLGTFFVTRDGWYDHGLLKDGTVLLINRSSDPETTFEGEIRGEGIKYGKDAPIYILPDFKAPIKDNMTTSTNGAELNKDMQRKDGIARGAMLHIGGFYIKEDGSTMALGGTYGCYGVIDPSQVLTYGGALCMLDSYKDGTFKTNSEYKPSNDEMNRVKTLIEKKRKDTWLGFSKEKILITIEKRKDVESKQIASPDK